MKKRGLFAALLGILLALGMLFAACGETASPKVEVETGGVPLGQFEITAPALDSTDEDVNPRISWTQELNAEEYLVQLSESADFSAVAAEERTERTHTAIGTTLKYSTKYYVRIFAMKEQDGKDIALSYASTAFTTQADHETPVPDNTVTRVIHDFEDFEDDDELQSFFTTHTGGDSLVPTLAEGEGADGSTAMKLTYTPEGRGWSAVQSINPADKKNWSGATGIRLWVSGTKGILKVSIGKRGYQRWTAGFSLDAGEAGYVSIPFSAFEDAGGGDGVWDMTGIVRLWFYFNASSAAEVLIDNVTIGSDALHSQDTREQFEQGTVPDYSTPKTLYDFETFADDTALQGEFYANAGGDPLNVTLAKGQGANGTAAMKVEYGAKSKGWCALQSRLTDIESNWTGAEGIRFWISGGGNGAQLTLQVGQGTAIDLRAQLTLNATEGMYVSIPFSAFTVNAGSLNLSNVNVLWIRIAPSSVSTGDYFLIDDISIGTGTDYNTDTRDAVTNPPKEGAEGIFENFESYGDVSEVNAKWKVSGSSAAASLVEKDGSQALKYYATAEFSLQANGYGLDEFDFTEINGFRMKLGLNYGSGASSATVTVTIGSEGNYYTVSKLFFATADNNAEYMVCDFAGMTLASGSEGDLDKSKIDFLQITVGGFTGAVDFRIDELEFYTEQVGAKGAAFTSDFSDDTTQNWGSAVLANGTATVSTANTSASLQYTNSSWTNYQNTYALRFKVKTENVVSISVRTLNGSGNGKSQVVSVGTDDEYEFIVYYDQMDVRNSLYTSMKFYYIQMYITFGSGGGSAEFSSVELLIG